jgi:hypothetical protein
VPRRVANFGAGLRVNARVLQWHVHHTRRLGLRPGLGPWLSLGSGPGPWGLGLA